MLSQILPHGKVDINKKHFNQTSWWSYVFETKEVRHLWGLNLEKQCSL